ncbi:GtrA family protein [Paracoccus sp. (in: a-proteobacteria)]|jgi:putative flippase GtrA|uniref:GtrA family protein n=1 Tax=Paracoccus sp. TaxID=267 RepID=UPI0035B4B902
MLNVAARFALTGGMATALHLAVALALIHLGTAPLVANALAFVIAFAVSFAGHHLLSFAGHGAALAPALLRFGLVSGLGFLANQMTLFLSLKSGLAGPGPALLAANACAALCSFMLSRFWVFR